MLNPRKLITLDQAEDKSEAFRNGIKGLLPLYVLNPDTDEFTAIKRSQIQEYYERKCTGNNNSLSICLINDEECITTVSINDYSLWLTEYDYEDAKMPF